MVEFLLRGKSTDLTKLTKKTNALTGGSAFFAPDSTVRKLFDNPHAGARSNFRKTDYQKNKQTLTGGSNFT